MRSERLKGFLTGIVTSVLVLALAGTAMAAYQKTATLDYTGIKITLDGKAVTPKDANGNAVEPFAIGGTTYLPVRGIASALGLDVVWDGAAQTVKLSTPGAATPPATGTLFYEGSTVPMLENITNVPYKSGPSDTSSGMFIYKYSLNTLPPISDAELDAGVDFISRYHKLLTEHGFSLVPAEVDGVMKMKDAGGQGFLLSLDPDGKYFGEPFLIITVDLRGTATAPAQKTSVAEGMYKVGSDIPAGTYKLSNTSSFMGYWERASDASGSFSSILANDNFSGTAYVTVSTGEYLKLVRCTGTLQ